MAGWLPSEEPARLLAAFPLRYLDIIAHHVTLDPNSLGLSAWPGEQSGEVVGQIDPDVGVHALIVRIGDTSVRADGGNLRITWSLDLSSARKPVESNDVIARLGGRAMPEALPVALLPAIL